MIQVKIYDKDFTALTLFSAGDIGSLEYAKTIGQIGTCSFTLDLSNAKVTEVNTRHYNRIEVLADGVVQWVGFIISTRVTLNLVEIKCRELVGILSKRLVTASYTLSGAAGTAVASLLSAINGDEATGITMGDTDVSATIDMTFNQQDAFSVLQSIASSVGAQFVVNEDRTLDFMNQIGDDVSGEVKLEYKVNLPQQSNILKFEVDNNGDVVVTKSYSKTSSLTSVQDDSALQAKYGILEKFNNFSIANSQPNLDALTASALSDSLFSPSLDLDPDELDNFKIGDLIKVQIENKLVAINDTFQVLEKNVKIVNSQKTINVKINQLPQDILNEIKELKVKVNLLETS